MTTEQSDRLSRIENNIDGLDAKVNDVRNCLTKTNGDIERLDAELTGKIDNLDERMHGKIDKLDAQMTGKIDKLDERVNGRMGELKTTLDLIAKNTSRKQDNKTKLYIAIVSAVVGGAIGALARMI
jgi:putative sterol carrier protein